MPIAGSRHGLTRVDEREREPAPDDPKARKPADPTLARFLALQRSLGNRAVAELVGHAPVRQIQRGAETVLQVQKGPSCWLYVLEALAKAEGLNTKYISMIMKSYPEKKTDDAARLEKQKQLEAQRKQRYGEGGREIDLRGASVALVADRLAKLVETLRGYNKPKAPAPQDADPGESGRREEVGISKALLEEYATTALGGTESVSVFEFPPSNTLSADYVIGEYAKAQERANKLATFINSPSDEPDAEPELRALLGGAPSLIESSGKQSQEDAHQGIRNQQKPCFAQVRMRYWLTAEQRASTVDPLDLTHRPLDALHETNHAILVDSYDEHGRLVIYKDPNVGNRRIRITLEQFQAMAGEKGIYLRSFFKDGPRKSRLSELE